MMSVRRSWLVVACAFVGGMVRADRVPSVTAEAPGWTFTEAEAPTFVLTNAPASVYWTMSDWTGRPLGSGPWAPGGRQAFAPCQPGYYRVRLSETTGRAPAGFDFCVVTTNRCRASSSFFAVDAALSGCSRRGSYACPWYGGDNPRVTAELLGKCGLVHTRERLEWGPFISPRKDVRDFSRYLHSARWMKEHGVVAVGCFHDAPAWIRKRTGNLPGDLVGLYRFMEAAAKTFDPYYDAWEFWNEPEGRTPTEPVWEFAAALKAYALGARAGSPTTVILPPSFMSPERFSYAKAMFDSETTKYVQAFNLHNYEHISDYPGLHREMRAFMADAGISGWQVWLTESGTALDGNGRRPSSRKGLMAHDAEQEMVIAEFAPKSAILHQMGGVFRNWFFLFGCYNEQSGCRDWGTMRRDGTVKPVHASFATQSSQLGDARLLGEKRLGQGLRAFVYLKPDGKRTLVFWSVSDLETSRGTIVRLNSECRRKVELRADDGDYPLVDMMGGTRTVTCRGGVLSLTATRWPQYLKGLAGVSVDARPVDAGKLAHYAPAADEDLSIVIRPILNSTDYAITGKKCRAEAQGETGRIRVEVWNLSDRAKEGGLFASAGTLACEPKVVSLKPWGMASVDCVYRADEVNLSYDLDIMGTFDGKRATRSRIPFMNQYAFLKTCRIEPLPALNDPKAWKRNDSGQSFSATCDKAEKAVLFETKWDGTTGKWFFPVHTLTTGESFKGARYIEFEAKSWQDKVENDMGHVEVMCLTPEGVKHANFAATGFDWEVRRAALPPGADRTTGFRIGCLPKGNHLKFWVRNFRLLKGK